ncbi:MAG: WGR domain-containing protein, partial [Gemmataceae bacterium]
MRTFEFVEGTSSKFWNITLSGKTFTVNFGKIGTAGQTQIKEFAGDEAARKEHDKLVAEKVKKGYAETTKAAAPKPAPAAPPPAPAPAPISAPSRVPLASAPASAVRTFAFSDATSHKFWNIELAGATFTVTYGKQGTAGTKQEKAFADEAAARKEHDKLVAEKVKKGYAETTPKAAAPASLKDALEAALAEKPDDLASHMAYADYLADHDDPRGEFIRIQLRLEDPALKPAERKKLAAQEAKLKGEHEKQWLGPLGEWLIDPKPHPRYDWRTLKSEWTWRRGWLDTLKVDNHTVNFGRALAHAPAARLLRHLHLGEDAYEEAGDFEPGPDVPEAEGSMALFPLVKATVLGNVRELILGEPGTPEEEGEGYFNCHTNGEAAAGVVKAMPKLEGLRLYAHRVDASQLFSMRTLPELRALVVYHGNSYPLGRLAKNPALKNLQELRFHPHAMDDDEPYIRLAGIRDLVRSAELPALRNLQIRLTDAGDKGVKEVVDSGILKRLKVLDLR